MPYSFHLSLYQFYNSLVVNAVMVELTATNATFPYFHNHFGFLILFINFSVCL